MATSQRPLLVGPVNSGHAVQYSAGWFNTTDTSSTKIHIKTSVPRANPGFMVTVEAVGYNYSNAQAIRCAWSFYQWQSTLYSVGLEVIYPGMTPEAVYFSSDNFVCLRGAWNSYFSGFQLNAYCANGDGAGNLITFPAIVTNNVTGNHF
jgi:hypothetical protein